MARLHVAYVSTYPPIPCGVGEYTHSLAEALASISPATRITVITLTEAAPKPYRHGHAHVVPALTRGNPQPAQLLEALEEVGGADILHIHHEYGIYGDTPAIIEAAAQAERRGLAAATAVTLHTVYHPAGLEPGKRTRLETQRAAAKKLDAVIVHSILQEFELQSQGADPTRLHLIPHGTTINPHTGENPDQLLESLGVDPAEAPRPRIASPGFLRPDKGLHTLLKALKLLHEKEVKATLIVAGEAQGARGEEVERLVEEAAQRRQLVFIHRYLSTDELHRLMAAADLLILPYEDRPGKYSVSGILHQAMGSLKPVIGTRVPRLVELYQQTPSLTVPPRSPQRLAETTAHALRDYEAAAAQASTLYAYAAKTHWPRTAHQHLQLYQQLLNN